MYNLLPKRSKIGGPINGRPGNHWRAVWACLWIFFYLVVLGLAIFATVMVIDTRSKLLWERDGATNNIVSKNGNSDVEVRSGNDLIIHDRMLHSGSDTAIDKISFTPVFPIGPTGDDFIFGDQGVPYSRLQAGLAIGFRLGTDSFLTPPNVLLGEDGLKMLIEPLGVRVASVFVPFFGIFIPSDERIKTNVTDLDPLEAIKNVLSLRPRTYHYTESWYEMLNEEGEQSEHPKRRGFIAQEVREVLPNSVKEGAIHLDGETLEDFLDVRKEDLVTEVVSATQMLYYNSIIILAHVDKPTECIDQIAPIDRASCVCEKRGVFCEGSGAGDPYCSETHPLDYLCSAV